ncbi:MAG: RidA family protein [Rhodospirillales bacterium]|nr:RidA family protein [Rhodospirillales bacterium]
MNIARVNAGKRMSQAAVHGGTVYLSGQVPTDLSADIRGQTAQVLEKIELLLAAARSGKSNLISATVWLSDMSMFAAMNEVWEAWIDPGNAPARACVEAKLANPGYLVEIAVIAGTLSSRSKSSPRP